MALEVTNLMRLRDAIKRLTYSEMMEFAQWLADAEIDRPAATDAFAFTINDWAEQYDETTQ